MRDLPVRGPGVRDLALRLPPRRMAPLRAGRPLKRWRYLGVYRPDVMLCVGDARVAGVPQRWWAVALPDGTLLEGSRGIELSAERAFVRGVLDLKLDEPAGVEVVSPHGRSYIWTRKHAPVEVRGRAERSGPRLGARRRRRLRRRVGRVPRPAHGLAMVGRPRAGPRTGGAWRGTWSTGCTTRRRRASAPSGSTASPARFRTRSLRRTSARSAGLRFREWSARESRMNRVLMRNSYRQPFGEFSGELPCGLRLAEGYGVMEEHDVRW